MADQVPLRVGQLFPACYRFLKLEGRILSIAGSVRTVAAVYPCVY
jgi:hypothetical protein